VSSGPVGLDSREYAYAIYGYVPLDTGPHFIGTNNKWLVTKIQFFAGAAADLLINLEGNQVDIAKTGCLTLEPNGAYRNTIFAQGPVDSLIVIEYWYQTDETGHPPPVVVT
jgi:hypothetical protein